MEAIYLSLRAQVAVGTFFMKSPVSSPPPPPLCKPFIIDMMILLLQPFI